MRAYSVLVVLLISAALYAQTAPDARSYISRGVVERDGTSAWVNANGPRPLAQAVDALEDEYGWLGWLIDYEDSPYESKYDLVDDTAPQWRMAHPDSKGVTRPSGGHFESWYSEVPGTRWSPEEIEKVLNKVVTDYNRSGNPGKFVVRREERNRYAIVGTAIRDNAGHEKLVAAILDTPISLTREERRADLTFQLICERLSAKLGIKAAYGDGADNLAIQSKVTVGGENLPARTLLLQTVDHMNGIRIWRLFYDADSKQYFLWFRNEVKPR
jgi:hypothetical protein